VTAPDALYRLDFGLDVQPEDLAALAAYEIRCQAGQLHPCVICLAPTDGVECISCAAGEEARAKRAEDVDD
jgi:hypothetical protein